GVVRELGRSERHRRAGRRGGGAQRRGCSCRRRRGGGCDGRRRHRGEPIDRLFADRLVETLIDVPAQQGGEVFARNRGFGHHRLFMKAARIGAHIAASAWLAIWPLSEGSST